MKIINEIYSEYFTILENRDSIKSVIRDELNEQFDFGTYSLDRSGSAIIKNTIKIVSPIDGKINNSLAISNCDNVVVVESLDQNYFLEFCNISDVRIQDNRRIRPEELIGKALGDVRVSLYNRKKKKIKLGSEEANILVLGRNYKEENKKTDNSGLGSEYEKPTVQKSTKEPGVKLAWDALGKIISYPFKNKVNPKTGEITQKRWADGGKKPVDPWIKRAITDPFGTKRRKQEKEKEKENLDSNLSEEIKRFKQLIN